MTQTLVKIIGIGKADAFFEDKKDLMGVVGFLSDVKDIHKGNWVAGSIDVVSGLPEKSYLYGMKTIIFHKIKVKRLE